MRMMRFAGGVALKGAAALLGCSLLISGTAARPVLAVMADKAKSFLCSASGACLAASNTGPGNGVSGTSTSSNGVQGNTSSAGASGIYGEADNSAGGAGVAGRTVNGTNDNSEAVLADGGTHGGLPLMVVQGAGTLAHMIVAYNQNTRTDTLILDNHGNLKISGLLTQGGSFSAGARRPTIEDTGEARLHDGEARVLLDPAFSRVVDPRAGYLVLVTPEGEIPAGLYVAQRTSNGFTVRENGVSTNGIPQRGRDGSSIMFAYRIVATPRRTTTMR
jgi:hypothetical protein